MVLGGCLEETEAATETITVTDDVGREVTAPHPLERIALLQSRLYWAVRLLGIQDRVVGTAGPTDAYPRLQEKPAVGWWREPNVEQIAELEPQALVTLWSGGNAKSSIDEIADALAPFDVEVVAINLGALQLDNVRLFGRLVGMESDLEPFLDWRAEKLAAVRGGVDEMEDAERPSVYYEADTDEWLARHEPPIHAAGGRNMIADELSDADVEQGTDFQVDAEYVFQEDPDVILLEDTPSPPRVMGYEAADSAGALEKREEFASRPGVSDLTAVRNDRVYVMDYRVLRAHKSWLGTLYLAKTLHPDRFADLDPVAVHHEFWEDWLDVPYQGTYFVPELE